MDVTRWNNGLGKRFPKILRHHRPQRGEKRPWENHLNHQTQKPENPNSSPEKTNFAGKGSSKTTSKTPKPVGKGENCVQSEKNQTTEVEKPLLEPRRKESISLEKADTYRE